MLMNYWLNIKKLQIHNEKYFNYKSKNLKEVKLEDHNLTIAL